MLSLSPGKTYFIFYSIAFVLYGAVVTSIGPLIPFFSQITGRTQTYYSFIFFSRAVGYILGGAIVKELTKRFNFHQIYVALMIVIGLSCIFSTLSLSFWNLLIWMFVIAACCCMLNVVTNLCIFKIFIGDRQDFWIQLIHLVFGVGGLVGPFTVVFFHQNALYVIGILFLVATPPFYFLKSPQMREDARQSQRAHPLPRKSQILICLLFLLYIGSEVGFASWIPTYATQTGIATPQGASLLSSQFWITNTVFRIVLLFIPGSVTSRLSLVLKGLLISMFGINILQFMGYYSATAYLGVFFSGMFISSMFALFLSVAIQYGFKVSPINTANFMMAASLGEGVLVMPIGYVMGIFGPHSLIVIIFLMALGMYIIFQLLIKDLVRQQQEIQKDAHQELMESPKLDNY